MHARVLPGPVGRVALPTLILALTATGLAGTVLAQDAHYWSNQYGTRANLLGGAVVGGISDLSATYYNPGAIAYAKDPKLVLATDAVQFRGIEVKNGAGAGLDLRSLQASAAPSIFAVRLGKPSLARRNRFAIAVVTRHDFDFQVNARRIEEGPPVADEPVFAGEITAQQRLYESWWGLTWARSYDHDRIGIGASTFLAFRGQRGRFQTVAQSVDATGSGSATITWDEFKYYNVRALWKIGAMTTFDSLRCGVALTTPSLDLLGRGSSNVNLSLIEVDDGSGGTRSLLGANYRQRLDANYKSPLSIAAGAAYEHGPTTVYFTAEWFDDLKPFTVIDAGDFIAQTSGDTVTTRLDHAAKSVINVGAGVEHHFSPLVALYGAFTTDYSSRAPGSQLAVASWDIFHVTVGAALRSRSLELTAGVSSGFGRKETERLADLGRRSLAAMIEQGSGVTIDFQSWKFLVGFSVAF